MLLRRLESTIGFLEKLKSPHMALPTRGVKLNLIRLVRMQSLSNQKNDCRRPERWHNTHAHMRVLSGLSLMRCHRLALCKRCPLFVVFPSHTPEWHQSYSFSSLSVPLCNLLCAEGPYIELEIRWIFIFFKWMCRLLAGLWDERKTRMPRPA